MHCACGSLAWCFLVVLSTFARPYHHYRHLGSLLIRFPILKYDEELLNSLYRCCLEEEMLLEEEM